jgi:hypothetical protein
MDVLGHDDVSDHRKMETPSHLFQYLEEQVTALRCPQHGHAVVATERDEVQVSAAVMAMQTFGHAEMLAG